MRSNVIVCDGPGVQNDNVRGLQRLLDQDYFVSVTREGV